MEVRRKVKEGVYPRVCGGSCQPRAQRTAGRGLSPRVRGIRPVFDALGIKQGSIPACAGDPAAGSPEDARRWVYPRVCGGSASLAASILRSGGLSPRVRGILLNAGDKA